MLLGEPSPFSRPRESSADLPILPLLNPHRLGSCHRVGTLNKSKNRISKNPIWHAILRRLWRSDKPMRTPEEQLRSAERLEDLARKAPEAKRRDLLKAAFVNRRLAWAQRQNLIQTENNQGPSTPPLEGEEPGQSWGEFMDATASLMENLEASGQQIEHYLEAYSVSKFRGGNVDHLGAPLLLLWRILDEGT